jgi:VWFA-related protein
MLRETIHAGDVVRIVHWRARPYIEQEYTGDVALLDAALERISAKSSGAQRDLATEVTDEQAAIIDTIKAVGAPNSGQSIEIDPNDEMVMLDIRSRAQIALWEMTQKVTAMKAMISAMPLSSKKAFVVLSNRLSAIAGGEFLYAGQTEGPLAPEDQQRFGTRKLMQSLIDAANSHGVTIYPMFAEGLRTPAFIERSKTPYENLVTLNETSSLITIAEQTGGRMAWSSSEVEKTLPLVRDDFVSYYSLAYRTPARHDDKARTLVVRAKNKAYTARARRQFVERTPATEVHDRVVASLFEPALRSQIPIDIELGAPSRKGKNRYSVKAKVRIPVKSLMTVADGEKRKGSFTVFTASARVVGMGADVTHETIPFFAKANPGEEFFTYEFELITDFLTTRLSVAVLDELSGEIGFVRAELPRTQ